MSTCLCFPAHAWHRGRHALAAWRSHRREEGSLSLLCGCFATCCLPRGVLLLASLLAGAIGTPDSTDSTPRSDRGTAKHQHSGLDSGNIRYMLRDELGSVPRSMRVTNILKLWEARGATKSITHFYDAQEALGEGSFGAVWKWRPKAVGDLGEPHVAVKHIRWTSIWKGRIRRRDQEQVMRQELMTLLVLDHPFIVKFREWFEQPCSGVFFVMELCTDHSLQDVLEDLCKLPAAGDRQARAPRLRKHFGEAVYAVNYLHSLDPPVVHMDLKPENLLLQHVGGTESVTKLVDFGLATRCSHKQGKAFHGGTPIFMAPEQYVSSCGEVTQEMDIWAVGVIFAWIVTALEHGSLQHPMLLMAEGQAFDVKWISLYWAYSDRQPWNRQLFGCQPGSAYQLCDQILQFDPGRRARASEILESDWACSRDPTSLVPTMLLSQGHMLDNIMTFHQLGSFDKQILSLAAEHATDLQVSLPRQAFQELDRTRSGRLSYLDFIEGFRGNGVELEEGLADAIFGAMDMDDSGRIEYHEWLAATIGQEVLLSNGVVGAAFWSLNVSGSGRITHAELACFAGGHVGDILREYNAEGEHGCIGFPHFRRLMEAIANRRHPLT